MAFGITRNELDEWKGKVSRGELAFLTHYWIHPRFPGIKTVTKVGCSNIVRLKDWVQAHDLNPDYIHWRDQFPHFDLIGQKQKEILVQEKLWSQISRFRILP